MPRESEPGKAKRGGVSRRSFIQTLGLSAATSALADKALAASRVGADEDGPEILGPGPVELALRINGKVLKATVEPGATLLEVLRHNLGLTGSKEICDRGACGGCSVIVDGKLVTACMMLAVDAVGSDVVTVEGLEHDGKLDPVQVAYIKHDALQCGYCTPGLIMATKWMLSEVPSPTLAQVKKYLAGNICRCGTYSNVFNAALEASGQRPVIDGRGA